MIRFECSNSFLSQYSVEVNGKIEVVKTKLCIDQCFPREVNLVNLYCQYQSRHN